MRSRHSVPVSDTRPLPLSDADLQRYRLQLDSRASTVPPGDRLMRKRGQSLEFREYNPYQPGDDVRFIDWRQSLTRGAPWELWKKTFDTEEAARIVVTVDQSSTLDAVSGKSQVAAWLAEAVSRVALLGRDRVVLHRMHSDATPSAEWRGRITELRGQSALAGLQISPGELSDSDSYAPSSVFRFLEPGVVWLIVSDFLAAPQSLQQLATSVSVATQRRATVAVIELDSWPWERSRIVGRPVQLLGPGIHLDPDRMRFDVETDLLDRVERKIEANRDAFFRRVHLGTLRSRWSWPAMDCEPACLNLESQFRDWFAGDPVVSELLMSGAAR